MHHSSLMNTLTKGDLPKGFLIWCSDFLQRRYQRVKVGDTVSSLREVTSGVPQGSKLAPYLFACHMGSLQPFHNNSRIFKYADDVIIVKPFAPSANINCEIIKEIENMKNWCDSNGLILNSNKTKLLIFNKRRLKTPLSLPLSPSTELKILGVLFQDNLLWDNHINYICKAASQRIYLLKQMKKFENITHQDLVQVYCSYIRSILEFNCPLFVGMNKKNKRKLELVHNRCHRIICGNDCRCEALGNLETRRESIAMKTFLNMLDPKHLIHFITPHFLPSSKRLNVPFSATQRRLSSFVPHCTLLYNQFFKV